MGAVVGGFCRQRKHICGGLCFNLGNMGKPETSGGASTYIYGLIFVLYAGIAVVLFIYMMNKRSKQQKPAESETATEPTTKDKAEKTDSSSKPKPTDRAAKEASPPATKEKGAA